MVSYSKTCIFVLSVLSFSFSFGSSFNYFVQSQLPLLYDKQEYIIEEIYAKNAIGCNRRCIAVGCAGILYRNSDQTDDIKCYNTTTHYDYNGTLSTTISGWTCQRWDVTIPHHHSISLSGADNFCRDPDSTGSPWCYTTDPSVRWEFCDVSRCMPPGTTCRLYNSTFDPDSYRDGYQYYIKT